MLKTAEPMSISSKWLTESIKWFCRVRVVTFSLKYSKEVICFELEHMTGQTFSVNDVYTRRASLASSITY